MEKIKGILKVPLLVAAVFIVARIVAEQVGVPNLVNNFISVVALYMLVFPIYFAIRIAHSGVARPYLTHFKLTILYATLCRLMIAPTYWLAYLLDWQAPRFSLQGGGVVGGPPGRAVVVPFVLLVMWVAGATVVGGGLGSLIIATTKKSSPDKDAVPQV